MDVARDQRVAAHTSHWRAAFKQWESSKIKPVELGEITLAGVPSSLRSKVWPRAIGNQLQITRQLYDIFKTHAKNARTAHAKGDANAYVSHEASISVLYKDLPRTFAELGFFHNGGPLEQPLREVLESYIFFRPDVGYVQGMSFIAAMLLLYVEPFEAFVCFSNMMNSAHFLPFYSMDLQHIHAYVSLHYCESPCLPPWHARHRVFLVAICYPHALLPSYFGAFQYFFQLHIPTLHQHFAYLDMQVQPLYPCAARMSFAHARCRLTCTSCPGCSLSSPRTSPSRLQRGSGTVISFSARRFLFALALECSNTSVLTCEFMFFRFRRQFHIFTRSIFHSLVQEAGRSRL
jgi:hypothetical protein